jgi:hypothetical protein
MYCGFEGVHHPYMYADGYPVFALDSGSEIHGTTAQVEVTCLRCEIALRRLRKKV